MEYEDQAFHGRKDSANPQNQNLSDREKLERNWKSMRKSYRQQYPGITDEEMDYRTGEFDTMTERIAQRTNRRRQDVQNDIRNWKHEEE